mmetsp:Transcript_92511/g.232632  ORF Transcript_92511/g.232632 Transcript_92511/m.232632 type:complete len:212 (-) Transcript_92511:832-1467(-)
MSQETTCSSGLQSGERIGAWGRCMPATAQHTLWRSPGILRDCLKPTEMVGHRRAMAGMVPTMAAVPHTALRRQQSPGTSPQGQRVERRRTEEARLRGHIHRHSTAGAARRRVLGDCTRITVLTSHTAGVHRHLSGPHMAAAGVHMAHLPRPWGMGTHRLMPTGHLRWVTTGGGRGQGRAPDLGSSAIQLPRTRPASLRSKRQSCGVLAVMV